jgi:hypothetical protein
LESRITNATGSPQDDEKPKGLSDEPDIEKDRRLALAEEIMREDRIALEKLAQ